MEEKVIDIDGHHVLISEQPGGEEWFICLHGLQSNHEVFQALLAKPFFRSCSLLSIDFIGFGASSKPKEFSYDIEDQAKLLEKLLSKLQINKCHIIGHSMGGMVGTLLLRILGKKAMSLINMEGNFVAEDCGASLSVVHQPFEEFSSHGYETFKREQSLSDAPGTQQRMSWLSQIPDYVFYRAARSIVDWSQKEKLLPIFLQAPQKSTLYLYGDRNTDKAARLPSEVQKAKIEHAGHRMLADNLSGCYSAIENFYTNTI